MTANTKVKRLLPVDSSQPLRCRCPYGSAWRLCASDELPGLGVCSECMEFTMHRGSVTHYIHEDTGAHVTTTDLSSCGP